MTVSTLLCSIEGCSKQAYAKTWCKAHYEMARLHGTPTPSKLTHPPCSVDGCDRPFYCKGFCVLHYGRWRAHGDPLVDKTRRRGVCIIEGCGKPARTKDLCNSHYAKQWRYGNPDYIAPPKVRPICSVEGCEREQYAKGVCKNHYKRLGKYGDPTAGAKSPESYDKTATCVVPGCENLVNNSRGWCHSHYETWRRRNHVGGPDDPSSPARATTVALVLERYFDRSGGEEACHPCTLAASTNGYVKWKGKGVHRLVWEAEHGPVPEGMTVSHDCHDRASHAGLCDGGDTCPHRHCGNLAHLSLKSLADNIRASGSTAAARGRARTHCAKGHELTPDNVYQYGNNRQCRACALERSRRQPSRI